MDVNVLKQRLEAWVQYTDKAEMLRKQIEDDLLTWKPVGGVSVEGARAYVSASAGSTDYFQAAMVAAVSEHYILQNQTTVTDWKAVCSAAGVSTDLLKKYYTPGKEIVKIARTKKDA